MKNEDYMLVSGQAGEEQLDGLDRSFGESSRAFLQMLGLRQDMCVADIGCGIGNISCWLAQQIGPQGRVVAIDKNPEQLTIAKQRAHAQRLYNVDFHCADVYDLSAFKESFDLSYCRYVLTHVKNPQHAIAEISHTLKPKGIMSIEEGYHPSHMIYPDSSMYTELFEFINQYLTQQGFDIEIANHLYWFCCQQPNFDFKVRFSTPVLTEQNAIMRYFREQLVGLLESTKPELLSKGIIDEGEVQNLTQQLKNYQYQNHTLVSLSRMTQVWGVRTA